MNKNQVKALSEQIYQAMGTEGKSSVLVLSVADRKGFTFLRGHAAKTVHSLIQTIGSNEDIKDIISLAAEITNLKNHTVPLSLKVAVVKDIMSSCNTKKEHGFNGTNRSNGSINLPKEIMEILGLCNGDCEKCPGDNHKETPGYSPN